MHSAAVCSPETHEATFIYQVEMQRRVVTRVEHKLGNPVTTAVKFPVVTDTVCAVVAIGFPNRSWTFQFQQSGDILHGGRLHPLTARPRVVRHVR